MSKKKLQEMGYRSLCELAAGGDPAIPQLKATIAQKREAFHKDIDLGKYSPEDEAWEAMDSMQSWYDCPSEKAAQYLKGYYRALIVCGHPGVSEEAMEELFFARLQYTEGKRTRKMLVFDGILTMLTKLTGPKLIKKAAKQKAA